MTTTKVDAPRHVVGATAPKAPPPPPPPPAVPSKPSAKPTADLKQVKAPATGQLELQKADIEGVQLPPNPNDRRTREAKAAENLKTEVEGSLLILNARDQRFEYKEIKAGQDLEKAVAKEAATGTAADVAKQQYVETSEAYKAAKKGQRQVMKPGLHAAEKTFKETRAAAEAAKAEKTAAQTALDAVDAAGNAKLGKALTAVGSTAGGVIGGLTVNSGVKKLHDPNASTTDKVAAGVDVVGGVTDMAAGATGVAATLGVQGVARASRVLGPVGVAIGGAADIIEGGGKVYDELSKDDGQPVNTIKVAQGGAKALGGGLMVAGAIASATGAGAVVGVPLMVVGGVVSAGASVWEMLQD